MREKNLAIVTVCFHDMFCLLGNTIINILIYRRFNGLFSAPKYLFPRKVSPATPSEVLKYTPFVKPSDQLSDQVLIRGTCYRTGFLVITKVFSEDVLHVGEVLKIVLRKNKVMFLILVSEAARNKLGFFDSLPSDTVALASYDALADYKPLIKRADNTCFPFALHHHVGPPPFDDGVLWFILDWFGT